MSVVPWFPEERVGIPRVSLLEETHGIGSAFACAGVLGGPPKLARKRVLAAALVTIASQSRPSAFRANSLAAGSTLSTPPSPNTEICR
jgi:hypothetical protein